MCVRVCVYICIYRAVRTRGQSLQEDANQPKSTATTPSSLSSHKRTRRLQTPHPWARRPLQR